MKYIRRGQEHYFKLNRLNIYSLWCLPGRCTIFLWLNQRVIKSICDSAYISKLYKYCNKVSLLELIIKCFIHLYIPTYTYIHTGTHIYVVNGPLFTWHLYWLCLYGKFMLIYIFSCLKLLATSLYQFFK